MKPRTQDFPIYNRRSTNKRNHCHPLARLEQALGHLCSRNVNGVRMYRDNRAKTV
ncbi:MAG: hypothetical protein LUF85_03085 [Bacteroides sp.]|nr:hypothetical protein [Bacteroides sp.]